jgi:hypothetical protein
MHDHHTGLIHDFSRGALASDKWRDMVELYTRRQLTYQTDLLPALSGIANRIHDRGRYVGGSWELGLARDIAWYSPVDCISNDQAVSSHEKDVYIAPSFLWASAKGPVSFLNIEGSTVELMPMFSIDAVSCTPSGLNPLGELSGGSISLTGWAIPGSFGHQLERPMDANVFMKQAKPNELCLWATLCVTGGGYHIFHPDRGRRPGVGLCCFLLYASNRPDSQTCYALVLARVDMVSPWYRLGIIGSLEKRDFELAVTEELIIH